MIRPGSTTSSRRPRSRSRTSTTTGPLARASTASSRRWTCSGRRSTTSGRRRPSATTGRILFRNLASAASIGCQRGPDPARFGLRAADGTEQRGLAGGAPANGPHRRRRTSFTTTRTRTPRRPARTRSSARRGTSPTWSASRSSGTCRATRERYGRPASVPAQEGRAMRLPGRALRTTALDRCEPRPAGLGPPVRRSAPGWWGLVLIVLLAIGSYLAYTKKLPVERPGLHADARPSRTPPRCARPLRCGSPASTWARSPTSSRKATRRR